MFPVLPIIAGGLTGKPIPEVIPGAFPFPLLVLGTILVQGSPIPGDWFFDAIVYYGFLGIIWGLAGFFTSGRIVKKVILSIPFPGCGFL